MLFVFGTGMLEPIFEPTFISDSYACHKGKGTHAAVGQQTDFSISSVKMIHGWTSDAMPAA
jgi:retron-type reverse transcriptase